MLALAQVNFALNLAGLIAIIYLLLAIVYFILILAWLAQRVTRLRGWALGL
jgi:flagellar biogenesis protein FliO